jgi:hypothetical protein
MLLCMDVDMAVEQGLPSIVLVSSCLACAAYCSMMQDCHHTAVWWSLPIFVGSVTFVKAHLSRTVRIFSIADCDRENVWPHDQHAL